MTLRLRTVFIVGIILVIIGFLWLERAILAPFIIAAIFAYILNPIVNFFDNKIKLPRALSVIIIYIILISILVAFIVFLAKGLIFESSEFKVSVLSFIQGAKYQINLLPEYVRPYVYDGLNSLSNVEFFKSSAIFRFFPKAISGGVTILIFLFSSFYFLKEGKHIIDKVLIFVPRDYKVEVEILLRKINTILGGYLRGEIYMIFLISSILFIVLSLLGVRFALIVAIFSGIAEIIPFIGPIIAAVVAVLAVLLGGGSFAYSLAPIQTAIIIVIVYIVLRQLQDYFIIPHVMGRITKLHPLIILFAVLAGGHSAGILGLLLAVPIAAVLKILLEFFVDTINDRENQIDNKKPGR
jgi:predicted PurR-regulated permease PerM